VCRPFFDQIVDSLHSKVLAQLAPAQDQAARAPDVALELREALQKHMPQGPLLAAIRTKRHEQGAGALRWSFLRKHKRDIFRMKCESVQEEVLQAAKGDASSPSASPSITTVSSSPTQQVADGCIPGIPLNSPPSVYALQAGAERRGGSRDMAAKQSGIVDKADVVCCHWKKKGWCKFHSGMVPGRVCKFSHPTHKQGVGREAAMKKLSASSEAPATVAASCAFQQQQYAAALSGGSKLPTAREPVRLDRLV
jgi:hypothetical protein